MVAQVNADSVAAIMLDRNAMRTSKKRGNILAATMPLTANRLKLTSGLVQYGIKRSATPKKMPTGRNTKNRKKQKYIGAKRDSATYPITSQVQIGNIASTTGIIVVLWAGAPKARDSF